MSTSVFYSSFERHAHGEGTNAHSTTYCPGCGHGLVQKYLADAIDELGVQDRTVLISPVGCAFFTAQIITSPICATFRLNLPLLLLPRSTLMHIPCLAPVLSAMSTYVCC